MNAASVVVWRIALDGERPPDAAAVAALSAQEHERAARFATDALRNRWLHGHVAMRKVLAAELGVPDDAIVYGANAYGKPFIARPAGSGIEFSYSDAGACALLAVSRAGPVGVDLESLDRRTDGETLAAARFAPGEYEALMAVPPAERVARFFAIWTRKEAVLKAIGEGIAFGLQRAVVPTDATLAGDVTIVAAGHVEPWALCDLVVRGGYAASLARPAGSRLLPLRDAP